jgi:glycosyltransferase involved in cell wall biosynthesis
MIHFVYAGDPDSGAIHAPLCITNRLYYYLKARTEVKFWRWDATDDIPLGPSDILLGHPNHNPDTVIQKAFRKHCRAKCLIFPLHTRRTTDNLPFDPLVRRADKVFSICGPYWYDTLPGTPFAHWQPKITRLDMAIDPIAYPYVKGEFTTHRQLLYLGSATPNKNLPFLVAIMKAMPDITLHWYGGEGRHQLARLRNVRTTGWVSLDRARAEEITRNCDIMVSTSDSDANPTTLLEAIAWGLVTACTKESGYYNDPLFTELPLNNVPLAVKVLRGLLAIPDLKERSLASRREIETKYTWDIFCEKVWDGIKGYL